MSDPPRAPITRLLDEIEGGREGATDELLDIVYDELRAMARARMARERPGQTIQATALVHEVFLQLLGPNGGSWENRRHFFGAAAEAMRRYFVHRARRQAAHKHGGDLRRVELGEAAGLSEPRAAELLSLDAALGELESQDERMALVIKLRYFAGFTVDEISRTLDISPRTVDRIWSGGRAWLHSRLATPERPATG